mgnify:CR=1 FL=1
MYLFGGNDEKNIPTDELYWISPDLKANQKTIDKKLGEYKGTNKPEGKMDARRIEPEGRGPIARA